MATMHGWPEESREAAQLVIDRYGEPDEETASVLIWNTPGPWKRIVSYRDFDPHEFPAPHTDSVESFLQHAVPPGKTGQLAGFDGSVVINRTRGELSARCHDEEANFLALNLAHDIIEGRKTVQEARDYYAHEFLAYRKKEPTPYMEGLRFRPNGDRDADERVLSDEDLQAAEEAGQGG
ncbi:MAG: hypothetical protein ACRDIZ_13145 [Actinomycetota bacterium]